MSTDPTRPAPADLRALLHAKEGEWTFRSFGAKYVISDDAAPIFKTNGYRSDHAHVQLACAAVNSLPSLLSDRASALALAREVVEWWQGEAVMQCAEPAFVSHARAFLAREAVAASSSEGGAK